MKQKKLATIALVAAMAIGTLGFSVPAKAADNSTDYTITIPATLTVEQKGWNATDGITAKVKSGDTFDSSKKLTVTAASANEWNLKSGENAIAYKMASATEQEKSYADATATTSIDISAEDLNTGNYKAPFGIVVEDYTDKPAGEYKDIVTFTAKVEDAAPAVTSLDAATTAWTTGTYAVPADGLTYSDAITVNGDVTLVLTDGETITLNKGISIADGATLTVQGDGTMNVNGTSGSTASTVAGDHGTLVLTSGTLNATGGNGASPTSDDTTASAGGVAINAAVTVNGGTLKATGGNGGNADRNVWHATGGAGGAAISGSLTINGGIVTRNAGSNGTGYSRYQNTGGTGGVAVAGTVTDNRN